MKKIILILLSAVGLIFSINSCKENKAENIKEVNKIDKAFLSNIKTTKTQLSNQIQEISLNGKIDYDPDKVINYVSLVNGVVDRTYFSLGDKVQKGQILIDLRSSELNMLQSELITLNSEIKIVERELQTAESLYKDGIISEKELFEVQARLNQIKASLKRIETDMSIYGYNKENGNFSIKAPMTGYIVNKNVNSGSTISSESSSLFTIADLSTVWVIANVYAKDLSFVKEEMDVSFTTLSYPGEIFYGKINTISQVFDPEEKTLKARIFVENEDLKFKPEMSTQIKLKNEKEIKLVSVPAESIIFDNDKYYIIVNNSDNDFEVREVAIYGHNNETTYISSGLDIDETIVIKNQLLIYSGLSEKI